MKVSKMKANALFCYWEQNGEMGKPGMISSGVAFSCNHRTSHVGPLAIHTELEETADSQHT